MLQQLHGHLRQLVRLGEHRDAGLGKHLVTRHLAGLFGHVHVAGGPGRAELDGNQEIHFPAVMRALLEAGYQGWVGQEFIPKRDPMASLRAALETCTV